MVPVSFVGSPRASWGFWPIFTPIRSFLSLEIRSSPLGVEIVEVDFDVGYIYRKTMFSIKLTHMFS